MSPNKDWSVLTTTWFSPRHGEPNPTVITPSKRSFAARFHIIDPFQQYHGKGYRLSDMDAWIT